MASIDKEKRGMIDSSHDGNHRILQDKRYRFTNTRMYGTEMIEALQILFGSVLALFLPGFALSWVFFPEKTEINWLERMALAFGLSTAIVPVTVFYANYLFGVAFNIQNLTLITAAMTIMAYLGYVERTKKSLSKRMKKKSLQ